MVIIMNGPKKMICGMVCALIILLPMLSGCDSVIDDAKDIIDNLPDSSDIDWTRENPQKLDFNLKDDGTYSVALGSEIYLEKIEIPKTYRGKAVTEIGRFGHEGSPNLYLEEIIIPDSVTTIGERAFEECGSLISIEIPSSVTSIGNKAFYKCVNLLKIVIPDSVTRMGYQAFYGCRNLASVQISQNLSNIEFDSFYGCISLSDIVIPSSVKAIGSGAFSGCTNLKNVTISDGVTRINGEAFLGCNQLTDIVVPNSVTSIGKDAFAQCRGIKSISLPFIGMANGSTNNAQLTYILGSKNKNSLKTVILTGGGRVGEMAFYGFTALENVVLLDGITEIGYAAFYECSKIKRLTIPDSVTSIGDAAFAYCDNLTGIVLSEGVTSIGDSAFYRCKSLSDIAIPSSVTSIGDSAFYSCNSLMSIEIPTGVTNISDNAFDGCYKLVEVINKSSLNIVAGSEDYGRVAYYAKEVHSGESKIVKQNDYRFYTYGDVNYLLGYVGNDTELVLPESYNGADYEIYQYTFYNFKINSIVIPESVTSIGDGAFEDCNVRMIYCIAASQPDGWDSNWSNYIPVTWGYKG